MITCKSKPATSPSTYCVGAAGSPGGAAYDEKNIRRRVYDALNVLMAMDIITKDKKEISWQGLPPAPASTLERLRNERARLRAKLQQQHAYLKVRPQLRPTNPCGLVKGRQTAQSSHPDRGHTGPRA